MPRSRYLGMMVLSVALVATHLRAARPDEPKPAPPAGAKAESTCVIYPLSDLGHDASLAKWVAETIPNMIQPGSWSQAGGTGKISYHAPSKVLVVYHTAAVHAQVEAFLKDLRRATPPAAAKPATGDGKVISAHYTDAGSSAKPLDAAAQKTMAYPVPPPLQQPKHLFHLIIRYEGDGIVDANVASVVKDIVTASKEGAADKPNADPAKGSSPLSHLLHFIVRYEGEGIIDANVAALLKDLYGAGAAQPRWCVPECAPAPPSGTTAPPAAPSLSCPSAPQPAPASAPTSRSVTPAPGPSTSPPAPKKSPAPGPSLSGFFWF
jgi:hypothetical protein